MVNHTSNAILERINHVIGNLVRTLNIKEAYFDEDDPWSGISAEEACEIISTTNRLKGYSMGLLVFGLDIILPIKHKVYW